MATNNINTVVDREWLLRSGSYVPTGSNPLTDGTTIPITVTLGRTGGIANLAAICSPKIDLGPVLPLTIDISAALEWFAAVAAGGTVDFYWSGSAHSTAANGNPGKVPGTDADYTGDGGGTVDESVVQLTDVGFFNTTNLVGVQTAKVGRFSPTYRYGSLIIVNKSATTICGTDDIESAILLYGTMPQVQAAV